ncbi:MAG: hypothetical protein ACOX0N_04280 [Syntrophomonadaceae bacterium]|jgi:hypothetical protein
MVDEGERDNKGFSGLSSLISNVTPVEETQEIMDIKDEVTNDIGPRKIVQERGWSSGLEYIREWFSEHRGKVIILAIFAGLYIWFTWPTTPTKESSPQTTATPKPSPVFEKPAIGTTTFNAAQIRWALREEIRLDTMRNYISSQSAIDAYNMMVDDFNRRAGHFKYYDSDMNTAKRDIERVRSQIVAEAIADAGKLSN